jgi:hypothetical protein
MRRATAALGFVLLTAGGCGVISIDMTSTPAAVRSGDPVTFDITLTNRSACPVQPPFVVLEAFISFEQLFAELQSELPPNPPPELIQFIEELRTFFDELCAGGTPMVPEFPTIASSGCARENDELVCRTTGAAPGHSGDDGGLTFATAGNRLRCSIDGSIMNCELRLPLPATANAGTSVAAMAQSLECLATDPSTSEGNAVCTVGSFQSPQGLAPGETATGQVVLNARGGGRLRNLAFVVSDAADDVGVCKGGADVGTACERGSSDCTGSTCGAGICDGGANLGNGCDPATAMVDCPNANCVLCATTSGAPFIPLDCTETQVAVQPAPVLAPWSLAGLALALGGAGIAWLRRRSRA